MRSVQMSLFDNPVMVGQAQLPKTNDHSFNSIELFAGAGGLALGLEKAGFNTIGLIEFDKDAASTLKKTVRTGMSSMTISLIFHAWIWNYILASKKANWIYYPAVRLAKRFLMREND